MSDNYLKEIYEFKFDYDNLDKFQELIKKSLIKVSEYLIKIVKDKFSLFNHLQALKRYLFLGQGDFIEALIAQLSTELSKEKRLIYAHNLSGILEFAVRSSNAQVLL